MGLPANVCSVTVKWPSADRGEDKRFEGSTRNGIKSLFVRSGDLAGGIESDGVTRGVTFSTLSRPSHRFQICLSEPSSACLTSR